MLATIALGAAQVCLSYDIIIKNIHLWIIWSACISNLWCLFCSLHSALLVEL